MATLRELLSVHRDPDSRTAGRWLIGRERSHVESLPREVEIELTTHDRHPDSLLRPRGDRLGRTGTIQLEIVEQVVRELSAWDDSLIVLGGFGDPLRHPEFAGILKRIRPLSAGQELGGPHGLCVRTRGVDLPDEHIDALIEHGVDVVSVLLDAWSPDLYRQLHSPKCCQTGADLGGVLTGLDRLAERKKSRKVIHPIVVPEFVKARENLHELDDFLDGWLRKLGAVCISGVSVYAGQFADHRVLSMAPPQRQACRRLRSRCLILADGRVTMCDQDFRGLHAIGRIGERSLADIWKKSGKSCAAITGKVATAVTRCARPATNGTGHRYATSNEGNSRSRNTGQEHRAG
jgi:pyruvate-formate lyase-activating enzyme